MSSTANEPVRPPSDQSGLPPPIALPSSLAPPTMVDDLQQQATQPESGHTVRSHVNREPGGNTAYPNELSKSGPDTLPENSVVNSPRDTGESFKKVPFKEQVIGVAQKTRGTLLGKPGLKDHGQRILEGEITHDEP